MTCDPMKKSLSNLFRRSLAGPALLLGSLFAVTACGPSESAVDRATSEGVLLFDNGAEPRALDPHLVTGMPEHRVIRSLLEGLVVEHPTDSNQVVPGVAASWASDPAARVWTFQLRPEARWSNGDPVTAGDFIFAFQRILNPALAAPYAEMLYLIEGAEAYHRGETTDWSTVGVRASDAHTLEFSLKGSADYFPLMLTHYTYFPLHRPTIEAHGALTSRTSAWTRVENHVGNGPFVLAEWRPNERIRVTRSPTYWDAEAVALNEIQFYPYSDRQTSHRNFLSERLHLTDTIPYNLRDAMRERYPELVAEDPMFATGYLGLNVRHEGISDARVRRAMHLVIDVQSIIDRVTKNGQPAQGFLPPGIEGYPYEERYVYDPEAARALMAEAGYPGGEGFPVLTFISTQSDNAKLFAEILQNVWQEELGIEVRIESKEWQVLIAEMDEGNFDIFQLSWIGDFIDPSTFLKIMISGGGNNRTGFADPLYDALIQRATREADRTARFALLAEAEKRLMDARPIIPLTWSRNLYLIHPDVRGWSHEKQLMDQPWKFVSLEPSGYEF